METGVEILSGIIFAYMWNLIMLPFLKGLKISGFSVSVNCFFNVAV